MYAQFSPPGCRNGGLCTCRPPGQQVHLQSGPSLPTNVLRHCVPRRCSRLVTQHQDPSVKNREQQAPRNMAACSQKQEDANAQDASITKAAGGFLGQLGQKLGSAVSSAAKAGVSAAFNAAFAGIKKDFYTKIATPEWVLDELFGTSASGAPHAARAAFHSAFCCIPTSEQMQQPNTTPLWYACLSMAPDEGTVAVQMATAALYADRDPTMWVRVPEPLLAATQAAADHMRTSTFNAALPHDSKLPGFICTIMKCPIGHCLTEADIRRMPRAQLPALYAAMGLACWVHINMWWSRGGDDWNESTDTVHLMRWHSCARVGYSRCAPELGPCYALSHRSCCVVCLLLEHTLCCLVLCTPCCVPRCCARWAWCFL